jgi:hypothetical protein
MRHVNAISSTQQIGKVHIGLHNRKGPETNHALSEDEEHEAHDTHEEQEQYQKHEEPCHR